MGRIAEAATLQASQEGGLVSVFSAKTRKAGKVAREKREEYQKANRAAVRHQNDKKRDDERERLKRLRTKARRGSSFEDLTTAALETFWRSVDDDDILPKLSKELDRLRPENLDPDTVSATEYLSAEETFDSAFRAAQLISVEIAARSDRVSDYELRQLRRLQKNEKRVVSMAEVRALLYPDEPLVNEVPSVDEVEVETKAKDRELVKAGAAERAKSRTRKEETVAS